MFKTHQQTIIKILADQSAKIDWQKALIQHQRMVARIQHERLIHLLVTIFVGLVLTISSLTMIVSLRIELLLLVVPLLILFVVYLFHYRFLENTTQKWYKLEEEMMGKG